ncbi:type II restriction endonuclease [uncultured Clostridium sp.]|uniref:type II restriction endonuclease n=1 Tax=uncultured Clostridium sp. TaxID=59620 RepID=UPI0025EF9C3F|nr:type II restriction endonuclease [uncultured Clostridium sp.]
MDFIKLVNEELNKEEIVWEVKGLIDSNKRIYTLGSDSKLIGRIFELIISGVLEDVAKKTGYKLVPSISQTVYPDFNLVSQENDEKIAIDIKTTYRRKNKKGELTNIGFTLGSYGSFLRNNTKNIQYPYNEYSKHYVIGFIYDRVENFTEGIRVESKNYDTIRGPYNNVELFIQEKYRIAGDKPGSGNTENIGSFKTNNVNLIKAGLGPFSFLGNEVFEQYWRGYPKYREVNKKYTNLEEYFDWLDRENINTKDIRTKYNKWKSYIKSFENRSIETNVKRQLIGKIAEESTEYKIKRKRKLKI